MTESALDPGLISMLKLAQRQGPKYDIGLFHKYVVSPRRFGIGSHRSDWDGGQARFGCTLVSLLTSVVALVESHCSNFFWRDWLIRFFFFFFLGYRIVVHSYQARKPSMTPDEPEVRRNTDLICMI